jgi:hypothetical protein
MRRVQVQEQGGGRGIDSHWPWGSKGNGGVCIQGQGGVVNTGGVVVLVEGNRVARC